MQFAVAGLRPRHVGPGRPVLSVVEGRPARALWNYLV